MLFLQKCFLVSFVGAIAWNSPAQAALVGQTSEGGCHGVTTPLNATTQKAGDFQLAGSWLHDMLDSVNSYRSQSNLQPLCLNSKLNAAAQGHATDMANNNYFSHSGLDGSSFVTRFNAQGFQWTSAAENIAAGQASVNQVMTTWMNSPGHRANILGNYQYFGAGVAYNSGSQYGYYWVQDFGSSNSESCCSNC